MDSVLYDAVTKDNIDVFKELELRLNIYEQRTASKSTVLHLACQYGSIKCVRHILSFHITLLLVINSTDETALHLAAREGHDEVVSALLVGAKSWHLGSESFQDTSFTAIQVLIRQIDVENETAMHVAVRYNQKNVVQQLLKDDPSHLYPQNKYGETPLYMASIRCYIDIIRTILDNSEFPTFDGPKGRTALHATLLDDGGHDVIYLTKVHTSESAKLLLGKYRDLIKKADNHGWTAFHYVAYNDLHTIVEDLVVADKSVGYLLNNYHSKTALHVAAYQGNVGVMKKLVEYYPDLWEIVDRHGKNILHIAVEQDQKEVIKFILSQGCRELNNLSIRRDREGNTPLHLIAKLGCYVQKFMDLKVLDWEVKNSEGLTPWDVLDSGQNGTLAADQAMVKTALIQAKVKRQCFRLQDIEMRGVEIKIPEDNIIKYIKKIHERNNTHIIVAALITTVAFTAGFTMPGGFDGNQGRTQGSPILLRNTAFQTFIITDAIALLLSISSLFLYFVTMITDDVVITIRLFLISSLLNFFSFIAMMLAFITGTYVVLAHSLAIAISVCVISSLFFFFIFYVLFKLIQVNGLAFS